MDVTVFGIGYVGLVQAAVLAEVGHEVVCVDINAERVESLKKGIIPIYEPGLTPLVQRNYEAGRLQFTTDAEFGVKHGKIQFIAVGTPPDEDGSADLQYVLAVAKTIATYMETPKVVVDKSTVPVGTADKVAECIAAILKARGVSLDFDVVSNPEFLKEGAAVADCQRPDRIVIGTDSAVAENKMRELYAPFNRNHEKLIVMDVRSAELTKYAANCMLATKISFMNEMANLAEKLGADIEKVRLGIGSDPRIGYHFIYPGCGYGGSCFPKDVQALVRTAEKVGYTPELLRSVEAVNGRQKEKLFNHLQSYFNGDLAGKRIALWGLSFKPNTDDMRDASSRVLMENLWAAGAIVQAYDPEAMNETQRIYGTRSDLNLMGTKESALNGADALAVCTEWNAFKAPDFDLIKETLNHAVIFDGRNLYDPAILEAQGIAYYGIGRGRSYND
ncbi:UDP-glucose 6-dehydrogenase [Zhongshania aliphaticivorans]|uniref:UDP-glucose 6-dehydrogenase n=1 Tax=Zhongshania aliphaticivorans TaxID=1470434 RepID=A0A5S9PNW0_9GAMM|nr:UDP-glucose/GDP-mannose dehydrogenase family protein [Zhongshania aliphaticivorans]CAA0105645.1 UDP-glucose 6-dehydrogenase [Zhongshania aliphaticivorans]CAA0105892.1 UDP-glucose 6-dehydrogenase [Zhongshania aliphaticivorans]